MGFCHCFNCARCLVGTFCLLRTNVPVQANCPTCDIPVEESRSPEYVLISQIIAGIIEANKAVDRTGRMAYKGIGPERKYLYNINCPPGMPGGRVVMKDYFPMEFHDIRTREEIGHQAFVTSWDFERGTRPIPAKGAGRSGSLFLLSADERFIFKTLPHSEVRTMKNILPHYQKYIANNPQSRLMRFLAMHRFQVRNNYIYIVVSTNIFYSPKGLTVDIKYDLKGRTPKLSTLRQPDKLKNPAKGGVWKDNQLHRKFFPDAAASLIANLAKDAHFLASLKCIDYSLLVGVHTVTETDEVSVTENPRGRECSHLYSFSQVHDDVGLGFPSTAVVREKEVYFFGIIDFLSRYLTKKKCAHFWKTFLWPEDTLSTIPEDLYCDRFVKYLSTVIEASEEVKANSEAKMPQLLDDTCGRVSDLKREKEYASENKKEALPVSPSFSGALPHSSSFSSRRFIPLAAASLSALYRKSSSLITPEPLPGPPPRDSFGDDSSTKKQLQPQQPPD